MQTKIQVPVEFSSSLSLISFSHALFHVSLGKLTQVAIWDALKVNVGVLFMCVSVSMCVCMCVSVYVNRDKIWSSLDH